MKRILIILLCCVCFTGCDAVSTNPATDAIETSPISLPESHDEVCEYLSNKYGKDFTYVGRNEKNILQYRTDDFSGPVNVYTLNDLWLGNYNMDHFSEPYADNGYIYAAHQEIYSKLWTYFESLPFHSMILEIRADVLPSAATIAHSYEVNLNNFSEYFQPLIYVVHEDILTHSDIAEVHAQLRANRVRAMVFFCRIPSSEWSDLTIEKIENNKIKYPISNVIDTNDAMVYS